jgi:glycosyltransferase involved in cell wall biosynthesis
VRKKICLVSSTMYFIDWFLMDQIRALSLAYDVSVCVQHDDPQYFSKKLVDARLVPTGILRKVSPLRDLLALIALVREFRRERYCLVHSTGPKGGLLGMLAAFLCGVPIRIHTFTGQVWTGHSGLSRLILKSFDRLIAGLSTHSLVDSHSQMRFLLEEGVVRSSKSHVLANGSISGVDVTRFSPNPAARDIVRSNHGLSSQDMVFLYMARITKDKGALLMAEGFARYSATVQSNAHLLVVGPDEEGLIPSMRQICVSCIERVHFLGYTTVPEQLIAASDILCLPSYREGFGTVLINAAAGGIPAVAARIYGSEDAVIDGVTGLLHRAGDTDDLVRCMRELACNSRLRARMGAQARERARQEFSQEVVTAAVVDFYSRLVPGEVRAI